MPCIHVVINDWCWHQCWYCHQCQRGRLLDHVVIDAKGLISKEQCLVIVYWCSDWWIMYCPWCKWFDVKWSHSHMMRCIDEDGSIWFHWYMMHRWRWINVLSFDAELDWCKIWLIIVLSWFYKWMNSKVVPLWWNPSREDSLWLSYPRSMVR